jgi:hypothetical protein
MSSASTCEPGMVIRANTVAERVQVLWSTTPIGSRHGRLVSTDRRG